MLGPLTNHVSLVSNSSTNCFASGDAGTGESCFSATAGMLLRPFGVGGSRMSQQSRRHDPYPWTWEIPLGVVLVILMMLVCGVHLGRGIANVLGGAGWAFPTRVELFRSLPAVLGGDAAAGLDGLNGSMSSAPAVWMWVVATEVMLLALSVLVLKLVL